MSTPEKLTARLDHLLGGRAARKAPTRARGGRPPRRRADLGVRRRRGRRRRGGRGDTRHAVPSRLDHEDVHGRSDHAAARRGQARPRGHARQARRGRGAHAVDPPASLARVGPAARDARRLVADASLRASGRAARDARRSAEMVLPSGARFHYSNLAYALLGIVVERVSGVPYMDYVRERLFEPVGLTRVSFEPEPPAAKGYLAQPYADGVWDTIERRDRRVGFRRAAVGDGRRPLPLGRVPRRSRRVDPREEERRGDANGAGDRRPRALARGLRARPELRRDGERILAGHSGSMPGFIARLYFSPEGEGRRGGAHERERRRASASSALALVRTTVEEWPVAPETWRVGEPPPDDVVPLLGIWFMEAAQVDVPLARRKARGALRRPMPDWEPPAVFERETDDRWRTVSGPEHGEALRIERGPDGSVTRLVWAGYPVDARAGPVARPVTEAPAPGDTVRPRSRRRRLVRPRRARKPLARAGARWARTALSRASDRSSQVGINLNRLLPGQPMGCLSPRAARRGLSRTRTASACCSSRVRRFRCGRGTSSTVRVATAHIIVGAGEGPSLVLACGRTRGPQGTRVPRRRRCTAPAASESRPRPPNRPRRMRSSRTRPGSGAARTGCPASSPTGAQHRE